MPNSKSEKSKTAKPTAKKAAATTAVSSNAPKAPSKTTKPAKTAKPAAKTATKSAPKAAAKTASKAPAAEKSTAKPAKPRKNHSSQFVQKQHQKLLELRDSILDTMIGVSKDNLRNRAEGSEASAFGLHQADAGSDAYDRDFALTLLSQEQDALYEIDEAIKRIADGTYGVCERSEELIPVERLEAMPFARYTVTCQAEIEKEGHGRYNRRHSGPIFNYLDDDDSSDDDSKD